MGKDPTATECDFFLPDIYSDVIGLPSGGLGRVTYNNTTSKYRNKLTSEHYHIQPLTSS